MLFLDVSETPNTKRHSPPRALRLERIDEKNARIDDKRLVS